MALCLTAQAAPPKDRGSIPSSDVVWLIFCNFGSRRSDTIFCPPRTPGTRVVHRRTCIQKTHTHKIIIEKNLTVI